jgi:hypothetical protein
MTSSHLTKSMQQKLGDLGGSHHSDDDDLTWINDDDEPCEAVIAAVNSEELEPSTGKNRPKHIPLSSNVHQKRKGVFVPDWAFALTENDSERIVLGQIDYWLGKGENGEIRARGIFNAEDGTYWMITCAGLGRMLRKSKDQIRRILDTLKEKKFNRKHRHRMREDFWGLRVRLDWEVIKPALYSTDLLAMEPQPSKEP